MGVALLIVDQVPPGHALPGRGQVHPDNALGVRLGAEDRQFQGGQGPAGVAAGHPGEVGQGLRRHLDPHGPQALVLVRQGPAQEGEEIRLGERLEDEDPGPGQERPDDLEIGVFGGGADQGEQPLLHVGQQGVLLGLVEAVDFVDQQDGAAALLLPAPGLLHHLAQVRHPGHDGAEAGELGVHDPGQGPGQRGLAAPRRTPEDHGGEQPLGLQGPPQQAPGPHQVLLAHEFLQAPGPQAGGQGLRRRE